MVLRFLRNLFFAVIILFIVGLITEINLPVTQPFEEYIAYVLTTNFDYRPVIKHFEQIGTTVSDWDLDMLLRGLPRITTGR